MATRTLLILSAMLAGAFAQNVFETRNRAQCAALRTDPDGDLYDELDKKHIELWQGIVLLICFGAFALFVCLIHRIIRTYVYYDAHLLDTFFDGGGDINAGLIACAVVAKWTWSFSYTHPAADARRFGLVGTFWFSAALAIQLFLFSIMAAEIRIKSPGAKTYLQAIRARLGKFAHIIILMFALFVNLMVCGMVMMEGIRILTAVTEDLGEEVTAVVIAIVVGFFTVVGGVGGYIYVAYFACALIMSVVLVYVTDTYFDPLSRNDNRWGDHQTIFNHINCSLTNINETDNEDYSPLTFISRDAMMQGIILILSAFTHMFVNQSYWQTAVAARPGHGVWGFIMGGLAWFAIPFALSFTFGMSYWTFSVQTGSPIISPEDAEQGLMPVYMSRLLMGRIGDFAMFVLTMAAVITTASSEVLGTSSIIIYDIYQTYIAPFRCTPVPEQQNMSKHMRRAILNEEYLEYDKRSMILKHVVVVSLSCLLIPIALVYTAIDVDAFWLYVFTAIIAGSSVLPITLAIAWHRITGYGVGVGAIVGMICGVGAWLIYASQLDGGLGKFRVNTGEHEPMIAGCGASLICGGITCIVISLCCGGCDKDRLEEEEWEKCRRVDSPILPWAVKYAPDIGPVNMTHGRPHFFTVRRTFKAAEICAYIFGVLMAVCAVLIWPALMLLMGTFKDDVFYVWVLLVTFWAAAAAVYLILIPLLWEIYRVCRQAYYNRTWSRSDQQRLDEDYSEPDKELPPRDPTPPPPPPPVVTTVPVDTHSLKSDSDMNSTMGRESGLTNTTSERWKTFIRLD